MELKLKLRKPVRVRPDYRATIHPMEDYIIVLDRTNPEFLEWRKKPGNEGKQIPDQFLARCTVDLLLHCCDPGEELWELIQKKKDLEIKFSFLIKELLDKEDEISAKLQEIFDFPNHKSRHIIKLTRDNGSH